MIKIRRKKRNTLPPDMVRDKSISCKGNEHEFNRITQLAEECDMSVSSYMLSRALNYRPKARLTDEEKILLQPLQDFRNSYLHFVNNLRDLEDADRKKLLSRHPFIIEWIENLEAMRQRLKDYLDAVKLSNHNPKRVTYGTSEK